MVEDEGKQKPEKSSKSKGDGSKKTKKNKKKMEETDVSKIISEVRDPEEKDSDTEEDEFWMPPVGDRWDFDDGKDRWGSELESDADPQSDEDMDPENDDANEAGTYNLITVQMNTCMMKHHFLISLKFRFESNLNTFWCLFSDAIGKESNNETQELSKRYNFCFPLGVVGAF